MSIEERESGFKLCLQEALYVTRFGNRWSGARPTTWPLRLLSSRDVKNFVYTETIGDINHLRQRVVSC